MGGVSSLVDLAEADFAGVDFPHAILEDLGLREAYARKSAARLANRQADASCPMIATVETVTVGF